MANKKPCELCGGQHKAKTHRQWDIASRVGVSNPSSIIHTYGISMEEYEKLYNKQKACCAICGGNTKLVIDHDHVTGRVRALLCYSCNIGLGFFKDSPINLRKAANYLRKHSRFVTKK